MAAYLVNATSSLSPLFYIVLLVIILKIASIIFFIKKLEYGSKQIWKSIGISILFTFGIQILLLIILSFLPGVPGPTCKVGASCSSNAEISLSFFPYTAPAIFIVVMLIYYIIKFIKNK